MKNIQNDISDWIQIAHTPNIGVRTIQKCLKIFPKIADIIQAHPNQLKHLLSDQQIQALKNSKSKYIDDAIKWLSANDHHHIIPFTHALYPDLLKEIAQPPVILYITGDPTLLQKPQIAMVGSRNPSPSGLEYATAFAYSLSKQGLCITSGLALGIDGAAHKGALAAKAPTIAVLGTGLNHIYPKRHHQLAQQIIESGCLISEFPLYSPPIPAHFPRRNRIVSGLSLGTLVVEAAPKSGSLITAKCALEQNREVFALPGSLRNPTALGCLQLIQDGAKCVTTVDDIINEINWLEKNIATSIPTHFTLKSQSTIDFSDKPVLACLEHDVVTTIDQICKRSKLPAQKVTASLLNLELQGYVSSRQGGYIKA